MSSGCTQDLAQFRAEQLLQHFGTQWNQIQQLSASESKEKNCKDVKRKEWLGLRSWLVDRHQVRASSLTSCFYFHWEKWGIEILMHTMSDYLLEAGIFIKGSEIQAVLWVLSTAEPQLLDVFHMCNAGSRFLWKKTLLFSIINETWAKKGKS